MSILWRFLWCIAAIAWAGNSVANPVSGAYLNQGKKSIELLQITAKNDDSLDGTLMQTRLQADGSLSQESTPIAGAIDGHSITIVLKNPLRSTNFSGTFDTSALGKGVITLILSNGIARYTESNIEGYQSALRHLKDQGDAIKKQRLIDSENETVAALNKRLTDYVAKVQDPHNARLLSEFHATHEKTLAKARHDLKTEQTHPRNSMRAGQISIEINQAQIGLQTYDDPWESTSKMGLSHLQELDAAIAQSPCAHSDAHLSNCEFEPDAIRSYEAIKPLVKRHSVDIASTIKADHAAMKDIVKQAYAYSRGRTVEKETPKQGTREKIAKAKREALKAAMRSAALGADDNNYAAKVRACIRPRVAYPVPPRSGPNPTVIYRANLSPRGLVESVEVKRSSGIPGFDQSVVKGVKSCSPFPLPPSGRYPSYIDGNYLMYDD